VLLQIIAHPFLVGVSLYNIGTSIPRRVPTMTQRPLQNVVHFARRMAEAAQDSAPPDAEALQHFALYHEDESFGLLVERHGSMVWGVCRRVLANFQDAEDCFQAAFLVLARKASTLQQDASLGAWLHRVTYRLALRIKATAARRKTAEGRAMTMNSATSKSDPCRNDLRELLDQELEQLPQIYRVVLVLCYLEGKSNAEAAKALNWPLGTVKGRLTRGRELLRGRLEKRGLALSGAVLAALLTDNVACAAVPRILFDATTIAAGAFAMGTAESTSSRALSLAREFLRAATLVTMVKSVFVVIALALATCGGVLFADSGFVQEQTAPKSTIASQVEVGTRPGVFFTAGLLGAGQYTLPAGNQFDLTKALSFVRSLDDPAAFEIQSLTDYVESLVDIWAPPPSRVTIIRRTPNGGETRIKVDLAAPMPEANQQLPIQNGDIIVLRRSEHGPVVGYCLSRVRMIDLVINVYQAAREAMKDDTHNKSAGRE
jgi:RNA polymerase sigma factor (sigma-70 family)